MYLGLQQKPFYFITDRQTFYQFLVDNRNKQNPQKHIYYPNQYQKMSPKSLQKNKKSIVFKFLKWSLTNQDKIQFNDKKVVNSVLVNSLIVIGICAFAAKSFRKIMFRTQIPVLQIKLQRMGFNIRLFKAFTSYTLFGLIMYKFLQSQLRQTYLSDLAFEYKYFFTDKMHSSTDTLFEQLWEERVKNKASEVV